MKVASASTSLLLLLSVRFWTRTQKLFTFTRFVITFSTMIMLWHSLPGALYVGKTFWSLPVSPSCNVSKRCDSYGLPHHTTIQSCCASFSFSPWLAFIHHRKSSSGNNLQCSQTYANVMAPLPSFSLTTCLKKSVLRHMMLFVNALLESTSASTSCKHFPIAFVVQVGISSFSSSPSLHTFPWPWVLFH